MGIAIFFSDAVTPYYNWINSLCRIYFATRKDNSPIPQMTREFMDAVLDSPSRVTSNQSSVPFVLKEENHDEETITPISEDMIRNSRVVSPSFPSGIRPNKKITTQQYIENVLKNNKNWKPRSSRKVKRSAKTKSC